MKSISVRILLAICLAAAPLALCGEGLKVVFTAPFDFIAGNTTLPAGTYQVSQDDGRFLLIQAVGKPGSAAVISYPIGRGAIGSGAVNFIRRGGSYYLNTVQIGDGRTVRLLVDGKSRP